MDEWLALRTTPNLEDQVTFFRGFLPLSFTSKTQMQMGEQHQTGHLPNEDQKLDSLRPGSREMERGR